MKISTVEPITSDELRDLGRELLERAPQLRGRVDFLELPPTADAMGPTAQQVLIDADPALIGAIVTITTAWLRAKRSRLRLWIEHGGTRVRVDVSTTDSEAKAAAIALIERVGQAHTGGAVERGEGRDEIG